MDAGDAYWNSGSGWQPIGDSSTQFTATFEGNGHVIANLFIDRGSTNHIGLFGSTGSAAVIRNVGLTGVSVSGNQYVGGLLGRNEGAVTASYAAGSVSGGLDVGGLVGWNQGTITASYATASASGRQYIGGLVGQNYNGSVTAGYATGGEPRRVS